MPNGYRVWPPGFQMKFDAGDAIEGVSFPGMLTINSIGMRGDEPIEGDGYRILAVGGSTTICAYLDDANVWPQLLQTRLRDALALPAVWVGNVGRPGHTSAQHLLQVGKLLPQHPEIDAVVLLVGINDLLLHLGILIDPPPGFLSNQPDPGAELRMAFTFVPGWDDDAPWYQRNFAGRLWRLAQWQPTSGRDGLRPMDEKGEFVQMVRRYREQASRTDEPLPDLRAALASYSRGLNGIIDVAQREGVRVVLLTQPTLWRADLSPADQKLVWGGGPVLDRLAPGAAYYSIEALAEGMVRYNAELLRVCAGRGVECVDVAAGMPQSTQIFYDDAHFTDAGAALLARLVADYLLATEPLEAGGARSY
jgi:lysophospholipase L1-like esterase